MADHNSHICVSIRQVMTVRHDGEYDSEALGTEDALDEKAAAEGALAEEAATEGAPAEEAAAEGALAEEAAAEGAPAEEAVAEEAAAEGAPAEEAAAEGAPAEEKTTPYEFDNVEDAKAKLESLQESFDKLDTKRTKVATLLDADPDNEKIATKYTKIEAEWDKEFGKVASLTAEITAMEIDELEPAENVESWHGSSKSGHSANQLVYELIDNSIAHRHPDANLRIEIHLYESDSSNKLAKKIDIIDNSKGIKYTLLPRAFTKHAMAGKHGKKSASEHGCGMKPGIRGIGSEVIFKTRPVRDGYTIELSTENIANLVNNKGLKNPKFTADLIQMEKGPENQGTHISITNLETRGKDLLKSGKGGVDKLRDLMNGLGVRYREFLNLDGPFGSKFATEGIKVFRHTKNGKIRKGFPKLVAPIEPLYGHNEHSGTWGTAVIPETALHTGDDSWKATLEIGVRPDSDTDWAKLGKAYKNPKHVRRKGSDPYHKKNKNGGIDIVYRNLVIAKSWKSDSEDDDVYLDIGAPNVHSKLRGVLRLEEGFASKSEKTGIFISDNFTECIDRVNDLIRGRIAGPDGEQIDYYYDYIEWKDAKTKPEQKIHNAMLWYYNDKLGAPRNESKKPFETANFFWPSIKKVGTERSAGGFGKVDILLNEGCGPTLFLRRNITIPVECKAANKADAQAIFQLYMYMKGLKTRRGIIVAPELIGDAQEVIKYLNSWKRGFNKVTIEHVRYPYADAKKHENYEFK